MNSSPTVFFTLNMLVRFVNIVIQPVTYKHSQKRRGKTDSAEQFDPAGCEIGFLRGGG